MNKLTSIILSFILVFFGSIVIANAPVSAVDEAATPDDAFEGNYTEFKGNDGSVTRVFENGSVSTKNKDGSTTAVDYKGNQYSEDKDGNYSVRLTTGEIATEYADGRQSMTDINGKIFTVYPDGHITEEYTHLGLVVDSNVDGETLGIGLIGSDERIEADENGFYENGEIKGKDGSALTVTDDGVNWINAEGNQYDFKEIGNTCTVSANYKDGSHCESTLTSSEDDGNRTENTDYLFVDADGTRWDGNKNITYDANGNPVHSNNDVMQATGTDGSSLWIDNNSKASQYSGADGNRIVTDKNGNLTEYRDGENDWKVTYDENGNVASSYMTFPDGTRIEKHPDGSEIFVTPDGTKYEADGKGNVFKDGEQIKNDGKWLISNESNETEKNSSSGNTLSAKDICGTYRLQGSEVWNDDSGQHEKNVSYTLTVSKADGDNMKFHFVSGEGSDSDAESYVAPYDEKTQTASYYTDDGDGGSVKFELKNGKVYANFKMHIEFRFTWDDEVIDVHNHDTTASGAKES